MTDAERQRRVTARRKAEGMVQIRKWVPAHAEAAVRVAIEAAVKDAAQHSGSVPAMSGDSINKEAP